MDEGSTSVLSTPIKKIRNLTLNSPSSPVRYPSMSDFPTGKDSIGQSMVEKGYSQTLSNKVLRELDTRATEISMRIASGMAPAQPVPVRNKRYSGIHRPLFLKMDSISSHYAAARPMAFAGSSPSRDIPSSATKKRRTLNGPEEIFAFNKENESPSHRKAPCGERIKTDDISVVPIDFGSLPEAFASAFSSRLPAPKLGPVSLAPPLRSSPIRLDLNLSPTRIPAPGSLPLRRISPSKGSMNLNLLLHEPFAKPVLPSRMRQSSLQMAGVVPEQRLDQPPSQQPYSFGLLRNSQSLIPSLQKKSSIPSLQKKPSVPSLQKKPSIASLQSKPSISNLQSKPSPSLQKKPSVSALQKPAVPTLQKKPSVPTLQKKPSVPSFQKPQVPSLQKKPLNSLGGLASALSTPSLQKKQSSSTLRSNVTVPQPFSLYYKPTVASSQKSFGSMQSSESSHSLSSQTTSRSLKRFQKFKNRFS